MRRVLAIAILVWQLPERLAGRAAAVLSLAPLGVAIYFLARFRSGAAGLQFVTDKLWISSLGIHYKVGLSGLNIVLVSLSLVVVAHLSFLMLTYTMLVTSSTLAKLTTPPKSPKCFKMLSTPPSLLKLYVKDSKRLVGNQW